MTKNQKGSIKLYLIMMLMHEFFYLLPKQVGPLSSFNVMFLLGGVMIAFVFLKEKGNFVLGEYGYFLLVIPVFIVLSAIGGYLHYDQPIISGLATQRLWLTTAWSYFVIMYLIRKGEITYDSFLQVLYAVVGTELVIYFAQWFLGEEHMFLNVQHNYRNGTIRLYCAVNYMTLLVLIAAEKLLGRKKIGVNLLYAVAIVLYYFLVNKGRMAILCLFFGLGLTVLLSREIPKRIKAVGLVAASGIVIYYVLNTDYLRDIYNVVFAGKADASFRVRTESYGFFLKKWVSSPYAFLFGYGYGNSNIEASCIATGISQHYLLADNGIFGFISCYGLLGLVWYVVYMSMLIRVGIRANKKGCSALLARCAMELVSITTGGSIFYVNFSFDTILLTILAELVPVDGRREYRHRLLRRSGAGYTENKEHTTAKGE